MAEVRDRLRRLEPSKAAERIEAFLNSDGHALNLNGQHLNDEELVQAITFILRTTEKCTDLSLMECSMGLAGFKEVCDALATNRSVRHANLSMNGVGNSPERAEAVSDLLLENDVLETLDVRDECMLGVEGCKVILNALIRNSNLVSFNMIPTQALKAQRCTKVDLSFEGVGVDEILILAHFARSNQIIEELNFAENCVCGRKRTQGLDKQNKVSREQQWLQTVGLRALCESFKRAPLINLNFHHTNLRQDGTKVLAHFLNVKRNSKLTALDLSNNELTHDDFNALSKALLDNNPFLTMLNMSHNSIGDGVMPKGKSREHHLTPTGALEYYQTEPKLRGIEALAELVTGAELLTHLDISGNSVYGEGFQVIGQALADNEFVTSLNMGDNYVGDEGVGICAEVVLSNLALTSLDLSNNRLCHEKTEGALALVQALPYSAIRTLKLCQNRLCVLSHDGIYGDYDRSILAELIRLLPQTKLTHVDLAMNNFSVADAELCQGARAKKHGVLISERYLVPDDQRIFDEWIT